MDYITPIQDDLKKKMDKFADTYKVLGFPHESPRWFNFKGFDMETKELTIGSTQCGLSFKLQTQFTLIHSVEEFWQQFKRWRTEWLRDNHPTINRY